MIPLDESANRQPSPAAWPSGTPAAHGWPCFDAADEISKGEEDGWAIPYVRHTFLNCGPSLQSRFGTGLRSHSAPVHSTCDRYATEVHALMFKTQPVRPARPRCTKRSTGPARPSMDESTKEDLAESAGMSSGGEGDTPASTTRGPTDSSAAEDGGFSEAEESRQLEQVQVSEEEPIESVLARVPYDDAGKPTSLGSLNHALGECRPCAFLGNEQRPCQNGARCPFCHFPHPTKRRIRLCRRKRLELRAAVVAAVIEAGSDGINPPPRYVPISWPCDAATSASEHIASNGR